MDNKMHHPQTWVDQYGDYLYNFALSRVRDTSIAEDLVQETFFAALKARKDFKGRSSERTWITGILKHKILDHIRKANREQLVDDVEFFANSIEELFDKNGKWKIKPSHWNADPAKIVDRKEFWEVFYRCLSELPNRLGQTFIFREIDGLTTKEICKVMDITQTNCWVILHRARMLLRRCLEIYGFGVKN